MLQPTPESTLATADPPPPGLAPSRSVWVLVRSLLGWGFVAVGLAFIPTPLPIGAVFLVVGLALLGPRNRLVRFCAASVLRSSRRWAQRGSPSARWILAATLAMRHSIQRLRTRWRR